MPTLEITSSILVNRGLGVHLTELEALTESDVSPASASLDVVGSFKDLVSKDATLHVDPALLDAVLGFRTPLDAATYFINAKFAELGGASGVLGATASAVAPTPNGAGFSRKFQHGVILWRAESGAHELHGPIRLRWQELGGEGGFLGFPTSDVTPGADVRTEGFFAHFQGGSIYWTPPRPSHLGAAAGVLLADAGVSASVASNLAVNPDLALATRVARETGVSAASRAAVHANGAATAPAALAAGHPALISERVGASIDIGAVIGAFETSAGAFEVHGAIRAKYLALGAEASILGYPKTDETGTPDGVGRFNHFQGGSIYWTPGTSAHEVHGLIRDRWASQGWERNPQLGYPITDELIPDLRIGHRRPETRKKPILSIPADVIKLPADARAAGFPASVVNTPLAVSRPALSSTVATRAAAAGVQPSVATGGALGRLSDKVGPAEFAAAEASAFQPELNLTLDPSLIGVLLNTAASTAADHRSVNRFADFENGVLFWFRGATSAISLSPLAAMADGTDVSFTGADIAAAALARLKSVFAFANANLVSLTFAGVTGYTFDGAQVHNRRHRLQATLMGSETQTISGPFGLPLPPAIIPVTATIELQVEVWFDAAQRRIALTPVDWTLTQAGSGGYAAAVSRALHARLDPLLWTSFELQTLPDTNAGEPIAVLSVKTLPNGSVGVYIEPHRNLLLTEVDLVSTTLNPTLNISTPNN